MHGRVKSVEQAKEENKTQEQRQEDLTRVRMYHDVVAKVLQLRKQNVLEPHILPLTSHLLLLNPDFHMLWGYRREIFKSIVSKSDTINSSPQNVEMAKTELKLTFDALHRNPKSYDAWYHRRWIIDQQLGNLEKEIALCDKLLEMDERNFHCWNYRRHVCKLAGISSAEQFSFTTTKIEQNFSNYSALHTRSIMFPSPKTIEKLQVEIEIIQQAVFTEPDDQSAWFYYRWIIRTAITLLSEQNTASQQTPATFIESQIEWMTQLYEMEMEAKWVLMALADLYACLTKLRESANELLKEKCCELYHRLIEIDSDKKNYYSDMISKIRAHV